MTLILFCFNDSSWKCEQGASGGWFCKMREIDWLNLV